MSDAAALKELLDEHNDPQALRALAETLTPVELVQLHEMEVEGDNRADVVAVLDEIIAEQSTGETTGQEILDGPAKDVIKYITAQDNADELKALLESEKGNANRTTVVGAIEKRLNELKNAPDPAAQKDNTEELEAILHGSEDEVVAHVQTMTGSAALNQMAAMEADGANREEVLAAIKKQVEENQKPSTVPDYCEPEYDGPLTATQAKARIEHLQKLGLDPDTLEKAQPKPEAKEKKKAKPEEGVPLHCQVDYDGPLTGTQATERLASLKKRGIDPDTLQKK